MNLPPVLLAALLLGATLAQTAPAPQVQGAPLPGEVQPVAPGVRPAPALPRLNLTPPIPGLSSLQYRSNGFIEVAHGVALLDRPAQTPAAQHALAGTIVRQAFAARPQLAEVDVSLYDRASYGGFGGPLPLFTASVPRTRLGDFEAFLAGGPPYDRVYEGAEREQLSPGPLDTLRERLITFFGSGRQLLEQQRKQVIALPGPATGGLFFKGSGVVPVAALTFDDAPHPIYTPLMLDLLRRAGIHATFFVIGRNAAAYPYFVRDLVQQGHEVGNHTYHHVRLPGLSASQVRAELTEANRVIAGITGQPIRYFRPPGGDYSPLTLSIAENLGLTTTFWTDDPGDFTNPGDKLEEKRLLGHLRQGGIVLLHDNAPDSVDILGAFLKTARARGVTLTTVSRLIRAGH